MMEKFSVDHDAFRDEVDDPHDQTCHWCYDEPHLSSWMSDVSSLIWLIGEPGSGKTVMAKHLVELLQRHDGTGKKTIYFFCDNKEKNGYKAAVILRSLIHQCMAIVKSLGRSHVKPTYETYSPLMLDSNFRLGQFFHQMMSDPEPGEWYCIIDAMDDCEDGETKAFLKWVGGEHQAVGGGHPGFLRLLITSRPCEAIRSAISKLKNVEVVHLTDSAGKQLNEADISTYIQDHVRGLEHYPPEMKPDMKKQLVEKAAGNFKCAVSMIHQLGTTPPEGYSALLAGIPSGMETMMDRIVNRARPESLLLIQLLVVVKRPLSVTELVTIITMKESPFTSLLALGSTHDSVLHKIRCTEEALTVRNEQILFFHPSVPAQLLKIWKDTDLADQHLRAAKACLIYLVSTKDSYQPLKGTPESQLQG